jgi:hypothetical protein
VTSNFEEAAVETLSPERDRCLQSILEFMAACGVRVTSPPPQLLELLTAYGFHAISIGRALAPVQQTTSPDGAGKADTPQQVDRERSGVLATLREMQASLDVDARSREPTRRLRTLDGNS